MLLRTYSFYFHIPLHLAVLLCFLLLVLLCPFWFNITSNFCTVPSGKGFTSNSASSLSSIIIFEPSCITGYPYSSLLPDILSIVLHTPSNGVFLSNESQYFLDISLSGCLSLLKTVTPEWGQLPTLFPLPNLSLSQKHHLNTQKSLFIHYLFHDFSIWTILVPLYCSVCIEIPTPYPVWWAITASPPVQVI